MYLKLFTIFCWLKKRELQKIIVNTNCAYIKQYYKISVFKTLDILKKVQEIPFKSGRFKGEGLKIEINSWTTLDFALKYLVAFIEDNIPELQFPEDRKC